MKNNPKLLDSVLEFSGKVFRVTKKIFQRDGEDVYVRDIIESQDSAAVLLLVDDHIVFVKQYREAVGEELLELPAGRVEAGEESADAAIREVAEETGYKLDNLTFMTEILPSPGALDEKIKIYFGHSSAKGEQKLDHDEQVEIVLIHKDRVAGLVTRGEIRDAKTLIGLFLAAGLGYLD